MSSHVPLDALLPLAASPATRKSSKTSRARRADASPSATKTRALDANADVQAVVGKRKRAKDVKTAENERAVLAKTRTRKKSRDGQKKKISRRGDGERGDGEREGEPHRPARPPRHRAPFDCDDRNRVAVGTSRERE